MKKYQKPITKRLVQRNELMLVLSKSVGDGQLSNESEFDVEVNKMPTMNSVWDDE
jgi:hypothetical protein